MFVPMYVCVKAAVVTQTLTVVALDSDCDIVIGVPYLSDT